MNLLGNIQRVYFLGIGGIGMSALARYFKATGKTVAGYDRSATQLTAQLASEGIEVFYDDDPALIPVPFRTPLSTLVVFTPAIPADHAGRRFFTDHQHVLYKRSQILGLITQRRKTIAVAGTHGKTTVSTMIAHVMAEAGTGCDAFLGGISKNFGSNLVFKPGSEWVVTEADEFDRSFLQLHPYAGIVTAMDPDHLDIYDSAERMIDAYNGFVSQINREGLLLMKKGLPVDPSVMPARVFTYSLHEAADFGAGNIRLENHRYYFDLEGPGILIRDMTVVHPGLVNVENAVAASAVSVLLGLEHDRVRSAMAGFSGILRRFDVRAVTGKTVYIDDYAHHPKEIEATIRSVRELYPGRKITGIFQPHLYSRTRDFAKDFAVSLSLLDRLILLDIYPARESPIEGVSSEMIFDKVGIDDKMMCTRENLMQVLRDSEIDVLITLGAGDIDRFAEPIAQLMKEGGSR